jgi:hypothetical protein
MITSGMVANNGVLQYYCIKTFTFDGTDSSPDLSYPIISKLSESLSTLTLYISINAFSTCSPLTPYCFNTLASFSSH